MSGNQQTSFHLSIPAESHGILPSGIRVYLTPKHLSLSCAETFFTAWPVKPQGALRVSRNIATVVLGSWDSIAKAPVGVVGAITPWNFPLAMITRKVGPALACGCTVVIKPSEITPLTALAAAELALKAGIPPGAVNVVMGRASDIGDTLLASTKVRKITFTGSTAVGKKLMAGAAGTLKKVSLELGGNAPCIVFDDADLDVAVKATLAAKFRNSGQTCVCANRVMVQEGMDCVVLA
ncbi:Succinate-semialdehyde dehydrogenase, mitochondrial [Asimina triloba]